MSGKTKAIRDNQISAGKQAGVIGTFTMFGTFIVSWVRDADPGWAWPENSDWAAIALFAAAIGWVSRTWADYRRNIARKSVIPLGDSMMKLRDVIGKVDGFDGED